jgi:MFS family permease
VREQAGIVLTVARDRTLARIELAYLGFNMAEAGTWVAILVYGYALGGVAVAGVVALVQLIPAGLVAPFAAYAGDRFRRDRVLLASYLLVAATCAATAVALYGGWPAPITIAVATTAAIGFTLTRPVQSAILPSITHSPADLTAANAVSGLIEALGLCLGPLLGGLLLFRSEPADAFAVFAAVSLACGVLVTGLAVDEGRVTAPESIGGAAVLRASFGGFGLLRREPRARLVVVLLGTAPLVLGALEILFVAVALDLFKIGESWAGYLYAAFGFGGILGALGAVALVGRRRLTPAIATSGALYGLPIAAVGQLPAFAAAPILFAVSGAGSTVNAVAGRTLLQRVSPTGLLARVFGVLEGLAMFALAIGSVVSGLLADRFGVSVALVVVGLVFPVVIIATWRGLSSLDRDARAPDKEALGLLRRNPIFAPLSAPVTERLLAELTWVEAPSGTVIIHQGDTGDRFYAIAEGRVGVVRDGALVREEGPGDSFGEIALLRDVPRTATVTALTPVRMVAIERDRFLEAVVGHARSREVAEELTLERLADDEISRMAPDGR